MIFGCNKVFLLWPFIMSVMKAHYSGAFRKKAGRMWEVISL
ncbi:hypothetical protein PAPH110629_04530 [Paenibacillus phoenicis]